MLDYWSSRLADALEKSRTAPTEQLRVVHLRTAAHYQALLSFGLPRQGSRLAA